MIILGVNAGHTHFGKQLRDGSASCLVLGSDHSVDGIRSIAEERVTRTKSAGGFDRSLYSLCAELGVSVADCDTVVVSSCCEEADETVIEDQLHECRQILRVPSHHLSHALSAFCLSPFEEALVVVWDCGGNSIDASSDEWWTANREQHSYFTASSSMIKSIDRDFYEPYEMGFGEIYRSLTHFLGFESHIDSAKAMALAAFGDPSILELGKLFKFVDGKLRSSVRFVPGCGSSHIERWLSNYPHLNIRPVPKGEAPSPLHADIAAYVQSEMVRCAAAKVEYLCTATGINNICLSGGVALNCVMNTAIRDSRLVEGVFIPPAAGDTGQSLGNCFYGYWKLAGKLPKIKGFTPYIGSGTGQRNDAVQAMASRNGQLHVVNADTHDACARIAARAIQAGYIIGWCQGNSEWGPRALGNRSILCRADNKDIEERLRGSIKGRLSFEPFAASVLLEDASKYFQCETPLPYMLETVQVNNEMRGVVQNATHVDGTSRIQTVTEYDNKLFYDLLRYYKEISGESVIVNTSLNRRGDPICESCEDALAFMLTSDLDMLFVEHNVFVAKDSVYEWLESNNKITNN